MNLSGEINSYCFKRLVFSLANVFSGNYLIVNRSLVSESRMFTTAERDDKFNDESFLQ